MGQVGLNQRSVIPLVYVDHELDITQSYGGTLVAKTRTTDDDRRLRPRVAPQVVVRFLVDGLLALAGAKGGDLPWTRALF